MGLTFLDRVLGSGIPYIMYAIPFFFALIGVEAAVSVAMGRTCYRLNDSISDLACGIIDQAVGIFLKTALFGGYLLCYAFVTSRGFNLVEVERYTPAVPSEAVRLVVVALLVTTRLTGAPASEAVHFPPAGLP